MTKKPILMIISLIFLVILGWVGNDLFRKYIDNKIKLPTIIRSKPLEKYTIENLSKTDFKPSKINITNNIFDFDVSGKKVTGLVNIPEGTGPFPIVVLIRGYVDQSIYQTGIGTKRVGEYFKNKGYITLAPDFLGYGGSDKESTNIFESRFQTYTTVLTLLKSIEDPNSALRAPLGKWDGKNIFIWAHSNGGQIALTVLEITKANYPTALWAPVTESFPYSILYYTNESDDGGKMIRQRLARFEEDYNVDDFSLTNYLDRINAPIEYHWGTADDAISSEWRDRFLKRMKTLNKDVTNYNHSGADHNMNPLWSEVIPKTFQFFEKQKN